MLELLFARQACGPGCPDFRQDIVRKSIRFANHFAVDSKLYLGAICHVVKLLDLGTQGSGVFLPRDEVVCWNEIWARAKDRASNSAVSLQIRGLAGAICKPAEKGVAGTCRRSTQGYASACRDAIGGEPLVDERGAERYQGGRDRIPEDRTVTHGFEVQLALIICRVNRRFNIAGKVNRSCRGARVDKRSVLEMRIEQVVLATYERRDDERNHNASE